MNSRLQLIRLIVSSIALSLILTYSCNVGAKETTTDHVVYKTPKTKKKKNNCSNMCEPGCLEIFQGLSLEIPVNPEDAKVENNIISITINFISEQMLNDDDDIS